MDFCPPPSYKWNSGEGFDNKNDAKIFEEEIYKYARENIAYVTLFIREPFAEKIKIAEKISPISFISDVGGLLGLFMGFSFVSLAELVYHAFKVCKYALKTSRNQSSMTFYN